MVDTELQRLTNSRFSSTVTAAQQSENVQVPPRQPLTPLSVTKLRSFLDPDPRSFSLFFNVRGLNFVKLKTNLLHHQAADNA